MYQIIQKLISKNRSGKKLVPAGMVVHETASPGDDALSEFNYFNKGAGGRKASAHAFIDWENILQTVPWNEQSWHAGSSANKQFIGVELCHTSDKEKFKAIWCRAVWLFAYCFIFECGIKTITKGNLMSHAEVSAKWHQTDHVDPVAYFKMFGKSVDDFREAVQTEIDLMLNCLSMEQAVKLLVKAKITASPGYWLKALPYGPVKGEYLEMLIINAAKHFTKGLESLLMTRDKAIDVLFKKNISYDPSYWRNYAKKGESASGRNTERLLIEIAKKLLK